MIDIDNNFIINKDITWHAYRIRQKDREKLHKHRAMVLWFTGLSGSGKSTLVNFLESNLYYRSINTYILDGDNIRHGLCKDLRFNFDDRYENIRRAGEVARLMVDAGLVVLAAFISPYRFERKMVRSMFSNDSFLEIFIDTPMHICKSRDPKGLYKNASLGKIKNFTGITDAYEVPEKPDIYLDGKKTISELLDYLLNIILFKIWL